MLKVLEDKELSAKENMQRDIDLLADLDGAVLRFHHWIAKFPVTCGYFVDPSKFLRLDRVDIAKRPTGGGVVFHGLDLSFAFLMPSGNRNFFLDPLKNYFFVNSIIKDAIEECFSIKGLYLINESCRAKNFCMERPTKFDILFKGKKIAGGAQRKTKKGYLHQATIPLIIEENELEKLVISGNNVIKSISYHTYPLTDKKGLKEVKKSLRFFLTKHFKKAVKL